MAVRLSAVSPRSAGSSVVLGGAEPGQTDQSPAGPRTRALPAGQHLLHRRGTYTQDLFYTICATYTLYTIDTIHNIHYILCIQYILYIIHTT